jgi:lipopolysaccharide export system protein LptC
MRVIGQKNLIIGVILAIFVLGTRWIVSTLSDEDAESVSKEHKMDYYLKNFTTTLMGVDGKPDKRLSAKRMLHYPDDDSTELEEPLITTFEVNAPKWKIQSETGWLSGDGELLLLQGKVTMDRPKSLNADPAHLVTRNLRVQPKQNYAETEESITITTPDNRITSKGMQAWLSTPMRIKFTANVRGKYEVN